MIHRAAHVAFIWGIALPALAAEDVKGGVLRALDAKQGAYAALALDIWRFAEVGYQEEKSSARLQDELSAAGFTVTRGVADMPTAFLGSYGQGKPVIAFLAEFDALPGLSQEAAPERKPIVRNNPGHGCGHHLFGTASVAAGIAVKGWLEQSKTPGTLRVYGTPAEEGGAGKVYLVRAGLFDDVDAVVTWHPSDKHSAGPDGTLANISAKFRFHGVSAHASGAPHEGRSALDGVEAMNHMVNLMREHVPSDARIHYIITRGGGAPNVVPDFAEAFYYARHPDVKVLDGIWQRILKAAEGAALGTGTRVEHEIIHGVYPMLTNDTLQKLMDANLRRVGGYAYTPEERAFAEKIRTSLTDLTLPIGSQEQVQPYKPGMSGGSTDVADVSWVVPTGQIDAATWVPGTPAHSWQAVAAGGMSIGAKGMMVAAKTMVLTAVDLFTGPAQVQKARQELESKRGPGFVYRPRVGDRKPPLDYRR